MIPNMYAGMANNPALLDAYVHSYKTLLNPFFTRINHHISNPLKSINS